MVHTRRTVGRVFTLLCPIVSTLFSPSLLASGFALIEQSVSGMGTAYAGGSAQANDATTVFFNPAGMTRIEKPQTIAGAHIVVLQAEYEDKGSTHVLGGGALGTKEGSDAGGAHLVPHFYYTRPVSDELFFGIGVNAPFGLFTDYSDGWIGRYHALESEAMSININPSLALKLNERLSLGAGFSAQYFDARITNAIDFGTIDVLQFGGGFGLVPGASDGDAELEGDDWSFGYNLGLLFEPSDTTRIGVHYRSRIKHRLEGKADFTVPGGGAIEGVTGLFVDTNVKADVELPATLSVSVVHDIDSRWSLMADVTWTEWNTMEELRFEFSNPLQPDGVTTLDWENTLRFGVGLEFKPDNQWIYRGGVAYDETPIPNAAKRTPRIPGESRLWVAFGVGYRYSDNLTFDLGYAHLFVDDPKIAKTPTGEDALRGGLTGSYDASVDILSAQLVWNFD